MEFIAFTLMTDYGENIGNIRAIRTIVPWNCILRTRSFMITDTEIVVIHAPQLKRVSRISEH